MHLISSPNLHLVFDIDDVLAYPIGKDDEKLAAYGLKKGLLITAKKAHIVFPGVKELLKLLYQNKIDICFFSSAQEERNVSFVQQLLEKTLEGEQREQIQKITKIFSKQHLRQGETYPNWRMQYVTFGLSGIHRKDLSVLALPSLDGVVLIDNDWSFAAPGQERNLLKVPYTDDGSFNFYGDLKEEIHLKANRIYFLTGFLFTAIEQSALEKKPITDWLFSVQFKKREDGTFKSCFEELGDTLAYYRKGLEILRTVNPNLEFCTPQLYEACFEEVAEGLLDEEERLQYESYQKHAADVDCVLM